MPLKIQIKCPECGISVWWIYEEGKEPTPPHLIGCPGEGCFAIHDLRITEIDEERAEELRDKKPFTR